MMSFDILANITANDTTNNVSSSGTPIGVKILIGAFIIVIVLVGAWLAALQQVWRQKWVGSHGSRYIKADTNLRGAARHVFGLAGRRHVACDVVIIPAAAGTALYYEVTWVGGHDEGEEKKRCTFLRYSLLGPLPHIHIKPEGFFGLANDDTNTKRQASNKEFDVKSEDEQATHALLTGPMQGFLVARMQKMHMEIVGGGAFFRLSNYKSEDSIVYANLMDE